MTDDREYVAKNEAELRRLRELCARLTTGDDFDRAVSPEWTVATTLAHLGFWDWVLNTALQNWALLPSDELASRVASDDGWIDGETAQPWVRLGVTVSALTAMSTDERNAALLPEWSALPGVEAARAAVEAAEGLDRTLVGLSAEIVRMIRDGTNAWMLNPWEHRAEHIDEIEAARAR